MGAADRPVRQPKLPQLYEAGPASGRIHCNGSWDRQHSSSGELDGTESPPVSSQVQQANTTATPAATVALRPDATEKHRWVVPRGSHSASPSRCRLELRGPELMGGRQLGTHHWVAEVEGVPDRQEVELHDGTALQLRDGSVWDIVQTPTGPSSAWAQAQHDTLPQHSMQRSQSAASAHAQVAAQRHWLPSPSAHRPQWPAHQQQSDQHPALHVQHQGPNHTSALPHEWQPQQWHREQQIPGVQTRLQELGGDVGWPHQQQQMQAYGVHPQQLQSAQERLAAQRHSLELDMLGAAMRDAAAQTGATLPKPAAAGPSAAAGRTCTPAKSRSSGGHVQQTLHASQNHAAVRQTAPGSAPSATQPFHDVASQSAATPSSTTSTDSRSQPTLKQQRSGVSRRSSGGQQTASQLQQGLPPKPDPQAAIAAYADQQPNGHPAASMQPTALSMPATQQTLLAGKLKIRLPQPAAKPASHALPSPVQPGSLLQPSDEPRPKRQRVADAGGAQAPAAPPSVSRRGSPKTHRQSQQQAAASATTWLPPIPQPPAQPTVPLTAPPTRTSPASQRSQMQLQHQQQPAGADTSQALPPGLQPAIQPSTSISKAQKAKPPSKPMQPRQQPGSTERAVAAKHSTADADVKAPGAQGLKKQQQRQQQRQQAPPGKAKLVEDDFISQRPASAAKSATAVAKSAAKQQGVTPTGTPARAAHAESKAGAKAASILDTAATASANRQRSASSQGRPSSAKLLPVPMPPQRRGQTPAGSSPASFHGEESPDGGETQLKAASTQLGKQHTPKADAKLQLQCEVECAKLRKLLGGLSKAKDTINPTSAHMMSAAEKLGCGRKMVQIIVERIAQEPELGRRIGMLYVVDSVLQGSQKSRAVEDGATSYASVFRNTIGAALPSLVDAVAKTREGRLRAVHVVGIWSARDLLPAKVLEPVASKLAADIAADEATPADPTIVAMARDRLAPMTFELSGASGAALRIRLKPEEDEEARLPTGTPPPLVRAEYAWLSVAKRDRAYSESPPPVAPGQDPWEAGPNPWEMGPEATWPTKASGVAQADMDMGSPLAPPPAPVHEVLVSPPRLPWAPRHEPSYISPVTADSVPQLQGSTGTQPYYSPEVAYSPSRSFEDVLLGRSSEQKAPPPWQHPAGQQPWQQAQQPLANVAQMPWPGGAAPGAPQHLSQQQPMLQNQSGYRQQQQYGQQPQAPQQRPPPQMPQWQPRPSQPQQPPAMQSAINQAMRALPPDIASAAQLQGSAARPPMHNVHQQPAPPLAQQPPQQHWQQRQQWQAQPPQQQQWQQPAAAVAFAQAAPQKHSAGLLQPPLPEDPPPLPDEDAPPPMPGEAPPAPDVDIMDFPPSPVGDAQPPLPPE